MLSRPHPNSFNRALQMLDGEQARRSRHHTAFLEPDAADIVLADDAKWLRERLAANGMPASAIAEHLAVLGNKETMEAALAWYRARGAIRGPLGPIRVPTLYIWGDADDTVGRTAAEGTVDFVAAPYRFEVLPGVGHFAADQAPERVSELMLEHVSDASGMTRASGAHAAFASSDTRSQVVACMLGRACMRVIHAARLACGAPSTDHSGTSVKNSTAGASMRSASEIVSPLK